MAGHQRHLVLRVLDPGADDDAAAVGVGFQNTFLVVTSGKSLFRSKGIWWSAKKKPGECRAWVP